MVAVGLTCTCTAYLHNEVKLCGTWDHYPVYTTIQDAEGPFQNSNSKKKRGWAGWRLVSENEKAKFKTKVMGADRTQGGKSLVEMQKQIGEAVKIINLSTRAMSPFHSSFRQSKGPPTHGFEHFAVRAHLKGELWPCRAESQTHQQRWVRAGVECPGYSTRRTNAGLMWLSARVHV